jgi:predicted RNase H-like nuclease (RuvC/YqgF family)
LLSAENIASESINEKSETTDDETGTEESVNSNSSSSASIGDILKENKSLQKKVDVLELQRDRFEKATKEINIQKGTISYLNTKYNDLKKEHENLKIAFNHQKDIIKALKQCISQIPSGNFLKIFSSFN